MFSRKHNFKCATLKIISPFVYEHNCKGNEFRPKTDYDSYNVRPKLMKKELLVKNQDWKRR